MSELTTLSPVVEISAGGIFALMMVREVLKFIQWKNGRNEKVDRFCSQHEKVMDMSTEVHDLHEMHNVKDPDGVPVWYVRRSLEAAIVELTKVIGKVGNQMDSLSHTTMEMREEMREIHKREG